MSTQVQQAAPHNVTSDGTSNPAFLDTSNQVSRPQQHPFAEKNARANSTTAVVVVPTRHQGT